jgi:hypothetical protein
MFTNCFKKTSGRDSDMQNNGFESTVGSDTISTFVTKPPPLSVVYMAVRVVQRRKAKTEAKNQRQRDAKRQNNRLGS